MTRYYVITRNYDGRDRVETRRTDRKAAEEDVRLFREICDRMAWIEEREEQE